jgi:quinone-modifying oxidoreductase, subunit QmoB
MNAPQEYPKIPRVLIIGAGTAAQAISSELAGLGYQVVFPQGNLSGISGFAGDFRVTLRDENDGAEAGQAGKEWSEQAGAVVFVPDLERQGFYEEYGLKESPQVITLERLSTLFPLSSSSCERELPSGQVNKAPDLNADSYLAFLLGLYSEGNAVDMRLALQTALEIRKAHQSQVAVFCRNVKVAEEGLERLYQTCRDEGILFFKFDQQGPELSLREGRMVLQFSDAVLEQPFELIPDLLVIDSARSLPENIRETALAAGVGLDRSRYLQSANVHHWPQFSQREGIFVAGPGKGPLSSGACIEEAKATALSVHHFFQGRCGDPLDREVTVDKGLCTICLTCFRFCPHQAIGWTHRVFIHPLACRRCGICASECPMDAIQIAGFSDQDIGRVLEETRERWAQEERSESKIVIFGCRRSAGIAWKEIQGSGYKFSGPVEFLELPCAGKLDPDYVLQALSVGAHGVLVLACPEENCKSIHGNTYAQDRIREARHYMTEAGLEAEQLCFGTLSSNQLWKLKEILNQFCDELRKIRNPQSKIQNQK